MKRKLIVLMAVMLAAVTTAWAHVSETTTEKIDGIVYNLYSDGHAEVGNNNTSEKFSGVDLVIPGSVIHTSGTYNVTGIVANAFCDDSFNYNNTTETITIPESITSIGQNAFAGLGKINTVYYNVEAEVCTIARDGFPRYNYNVVFGPKVKEIPVNLFSQNTQEVEIPSQIKKIRAEAFKNCSQLKTVTFNEGLEEIENSAFGFCKALADFTLPNSLMKIGSSAFTYCEKLTSVVIPNALEEIGSGAFSYCTKLERLVLGQGLTEIGSGLLGNCNAVTEIVCLRESAPTLAGSFGGSIGTATIKVPKGCIDAYVSATYWPTNRDKYVEFDPNDIVDYKVLDENAQTAEAYIPDYADKTTMGALTIKSSVNIGGTDYEVVKISDNCFEDCSGISALTLPASITAIGDNAFKNCSALTKITMFAESVPTLGDDAFEGTSSVMIYVLASALSTYQSAWSGMDVQAMKYIAYKSNAKIESLEEKLEGLTSVISHTFENGEGYIYYEGNVTKVLTKACEQNHDLQEIVIPEGVTEIGNRAFNQCTNLTSITLPTTLTALSEAAFHSCTSLTSISLPTALTTIGTSCFSGCNQLQSITIPGNVETIGEDAFSGCSALESVVLSDKLTSLAERLFQSCTSLSTVTLPQNLATIGANVFRVC